MSGGPPRPSLQASTCGKFMSQGMIAPMNPFVDGNGALSPVGYRFLFALFNNVHYLEYGGVGLTAQPGIEALAATIRALSDRLAAVEARLPPPPP